MTCGDDGCGSTCGVCDAGTFCDDAGTCAVDCGETCDTLGLECGAHCGVSCGDCHTGTYCVAGACSCAPDCAGKVCGASDGCGGSCEPCERAVSCDDCSLRLVVVDRTVVDGRTTAVDVAVEYHPVEEATAPAIADLRLQVDGPGVVSRVGLEQGLIDSGKTLFQYPSTGQRFRQLEDGTLQLIVMSMQPSGPISTGRWAYLRVVLDPEGHGADLPTSVSLVPREEIFAPPAADTALHGQALGTPIVVWPVDLAPASGGVDAP